MKVYIAGPMTGYENFNYEAFHAAEAALRAAGYEPINTAHHEVENDTGKPQTWEWYLRRAIKALMDADAVALLPGWQASEGANLERRLAKRLGMRVLPIERWLA